MNCSSCGSSCVVPCQTGTRCNQCGVQTKGFRGQDLPKAYVSSSIPPGGVQKKAASAGTLNKPVTQSQTITVPVNKTIDIVAKEETPVESAPKAAKIEVKPEVKTVPVLSPVVTPEKKEAK